MLDRSKVLKALQTISDNLFVDYSDEAELAEKIWQIISKNPEFAIKVASATCTDLILPTWQGNLCDVYDVAPALAYSVTGIDGSQIYPDKHQGTTCYLLNVGTVHLSYGTATKPVVLTTTPYVYTGNEDDIFDNSQETINCRRLALELQAGKEAQSNLVLFDGSLIFWHLESKEKNIKEYFLPQYFLALEQLYEQQMLCASYISLPKSKELVNLIRFYLKENKEDKGVDHMVDTNIAHFYLQPQQRTTIFYNHSPITKQYPEHLTPCFFYMHVGDEIGRVEIPFWIAINKELVDTVASIVFDQSRKGHGYPVCLSEAHEQAVVKGPDRDFFYHCIQKFGIEQKKRISMSLKSMKKRRIGI